MRPRLSIRLLAFLLVAVLLSMCLDTASDTSTDDGARSVVAGAEAASLVGASGGTIRLTQGPAQGATLVIPPGALTKPVMITMRAGERATNLPSGVVSAGPVVVFGPEGQRFKHPVTVTLPTSHGATRNFRTLYTRPLRAPNWTEVPAAHYDPARGMVAQVTHFSEYLPAQYMGAANMVWHDEFDGPAINTNNWAFDTGTGFNGEGWGNSELEYYTNRPENARIEDGKLVIEARKEQYQNREYTSARLKTTPLTPWTYGLIQARIKLLPGKGMWPAFWMLGSSCNTGGRWPDCGEIDILEFVGDRQNTVLGAIHWFDTGNNHGVFNIAYTDSVTNFTDDYHVYSVIWDSTDIHWFVDERRYVSSMGFTVATIKDNVNNTGAFHRPFFILLNLAVGGSLPGNPDSTTTFPTRMLVDWVRVYQSCVTDSTTSSPLPKCLSPTIPPPHTWRPLTERCTVGDEQWRCGWELYHYKVQQNTDSSHSNNLFKCAGANIGDPGTWKWIGRCEGGTNCVICPNNYQNHGTTQCIDPAKLTNECYDDRTIK